MTLRDAWQTHAAAAARIPSFLGGTMRPFFIALLFPCLFILGCGDDITNNYGPEDWQPPVIEWRYQPDAEIRGTVGIDVFVTDDSEVVWVRLYVDGLLAIELQSPPYRFEFDSDTLEDGIHVLEARAQDEYGNLGIGPVLQVNVANSVAQGPRVLWVPDTFSTIQTAINAAVDYDTIRVREGTYYEALNTFDKGLWIESEYGPLSATIDGLNTGSTIYVPHHQVASTVRGFRITGANTVIGYDDAAQLSLYNNIISSDTAWTLLISGYSAGQIHNNLFSGAEYGVLMGYHWGTLYNNILQDVQFVAMWNVAVYRNPLLYGYNLFWRNGANYYDFEPGNGDIDADPLIDIEHGILLPESPAIDSGHPGILDIDGSRSDIGPFGGAWAYSNDKGRKQSEVYHGFMGKSSKQPVPAGHGLQRAATDGQEPFGGRESHTK